MPVSTISQAGLDAPISLTSPTLTTPNIDSAQIATVSGTAPLYMCRAWVNFNGTSTVAIRASGNVSSITDNGTGDYTVNFTTAMSDANYTVGGITMRGSVNTDSLLFLPLNGTYTSTACRVLSTAASSSSLLHDAVIVNVFFFR